MNDRLRCAALIFGLSCLATGCIKDPKLTSAETLKTVPVYQLGTGDTVRISVYNEPGISGDLMVASDGTLPMPLLGSMKVAGMVPDQVRAAITQGLAGGYVNNPKVSVQVIGFRPYYVVGEVSRPGRYPVGDRVTLLRAIATAGGYTYRANHKYFYLRRDGQPEVKVLADTDPQILPGDVVRIGERYF